MPRNYDGKYGTKEDISYKDGLLDSLFTDSVAPDLTDVDEALETPVLVIDLDEVSNEAMRQAKLITERLSNYYFDEKYIREHPYIPSKIAQEMDNIRRLLKMLAVNEKAQDTLITNITQSAGKGALYQSLTSLQNSMLSMQNQLNQLINNLETIFQEMQANCEKTFEEKDKEVADDGSVTIRGSRDFIKEIERAMKGNNFTLEISNPIKDNEEGDVNVEEVSE